MTPWLTLVIGVILGLLLGWLIDMFLARRKNTVRVADEIDVSARSVEPAAPLLPTGVETPAAAGAWEPEPQVADLPAAVEPQEPAGQVDWREVSDRVGRVAEEAPEKPAHLEAAVPETTPGLPADAIEALAPPPAFQPMGGKGDDLLRIEGIGPVYDRRLREAGIGTFAALSVAAEDRLQEIIHPQSWQRVNFAEWIEQARLIVEGNEEGLRLLQERLFSRKKS